MNKTKEIKKLKKEIKRLHNEIEYLYTGLFLVNQAMKLQTENAEDLESRLEEVEDSSAYNWSTLYSIIEKFGLDDDETDTENENKKNTPKEPAKEQPASKKKGKEKKDEESK